MTKQDIIKQQAAIIEELQNKINNMEDVKNKALEMEKRALQAEALLEEKNFRIKYLELEVKMLQNAKYGRKSDSAVNTEQRNLFNFETFNEAEATADIEVKDPEINNEETKEVKFVAKKKKNLINRLENLTEETIIHDISEEEKICQECGTKLTKIGESKTIKLVYVPSKLIKQIHIYPKYKCEKCENESIKTKIYESPYELAFPKTMVDSSIVSRIIVEKYLKYVPLYRQEKFYQNNGLDISRINLSNWVLSTKQYLKPLFDLMHRDVLQNDIVLMDETTLNVLESEKSQNYVWILRTSKFDIPTILYFYKESREHHNANDILTGFKGHFIQSDGYEAYQKIDGVTDVCCWEHAKRRFTNILKVTDKNNTYKIMNSYCNTAIDYINKLYKIEKELRKSKASIKEIFDTRKEKSIPIINEYFKWLKSIDDIFPKSSKMYDAVHYSLNHEELLKNYCLDGRLEVDNNSSERAAKSLILGRKNFLFCVSEVGAEVSTIIYSIVETAIANQLNVNEYLIYVFNNMAKIIKNSEKDKLDEETIRNLLPYSKTLPESLKVKKIA